jgi:hypothetical protein
VYTIVTPIPAKDGLVDIFDNGGGHVFVGRVGGATPGAGDRLFPMVNIAGTGAGGTITQQTGSLISRVRKGAMLYSSIQKKYPDVYPGGTPGLYQVFSGCTVNNLSFSMQPGSLVTGTADLLGLEAGNLIKESDSASAVAAANPGAASTAYSPFASCAGIGEGAVAVVSGIDFTINNNRETVPLLCSAFADSVYEGVANVSGTMTLLFENEAEYNKFALETESKVMISLDGGAADGLDSMFFHFPRVRYTQPSFEVPANGPVVLTLNFRALESDYGLAGSPVRTSCVIGRA